MRLPGLGTNAAFNIVKAREEGEFLSKEDLQQRGKVSKTILEYSWITQGCLRRHLPDAKPTFIILEMKSLLRSTVSLRMTIR